MHIIIYLVCEKTVGDSAYTVVIPLKRGIQLIDVGCSVLDVGC